MFVILGATGNTGGSAARALLAAGRPVRVVGRSAEKLAPLVALGAEAVRADVTDARALASAFRDATGAYVLIPPNLDVDDFRGYQRQTTAAIAEGLRTAEVPLVVALSSVGADKPAGTGPIVGLYELEGALRDIAGQRSLFVRAGYFMENFFMNLGVVKSQGVNGSPMLPDVPMGLIASRDIGEYVAKRLAAGDVRGKEVVNLVGPDLLTMKVATAQLGRALGLAELPYVQFPYEAAEAGMVQMGLKPQMAALYVEMARGANEGLLAPAPGTPVVQTNTHFADFARTVLAPAYRG